ncbi:hypothetical protein [Rubritalea tangerina]|uniref:hypothetical protein n=1 Tax=Rubritalea tangerina TaxID=430798 RepID=UPI003619CD94
MKTFVSIFLILSTVALSIMSLVQLGQVDFASEFSNADAKPTNTRLFDHDLRATANVVIESNRFPTHAFSYSPENGLWMGVEPWQDRADGPKAIEKLVLFALNAEIQDSLPATPDNLQALGFEEQAINILFTNSLNDTIANFSIGATSAWHKKIEGKQELLIPTVYLRLRNSDLDDHIYLCTDTTGDIQKLFSDKLTHFRDHRPFALNIQTLNQVRLLRDKTEILLTHPTPNAPWMLTKPLELPTDRSAVMKFLANLSKLEAIALHSTDSVTLPESSDSQFEIAVTTFGSDDETTLKVSPPPKVLARVTPPSVTAMSSSNSPSSPPPIPRTILPNSRSRSMNCAHAR